MVKSKLSNDASISSIFIAGAVIISWKSVPAQKSSIIVSADAELGSVPG